MTVHKSRTLLWLMIGLILIAALSFLFWPRAVITDIGTLNKSPFRMSISEEGKTRVHDIYVLSAPVTGHLRRIDADVGDPVEMSRTIVAEIEPIDPTFLDPRSEAQAKADIEAASSSMKLARAEVKQAEAELEFASSELARMRELRVNVSVSQRELDNARRTFKTSRAALATAQAALQMRTFEHERMEAQLLSPATTQSQRGRCQCLNILAPVNGQILKIINKSEGVVSAGTPLVEIGDPADIEIVIELLSSDAVKVEPGKLVEIRNWGGEGVLSGRVNRIEPVGFMKVSALGIEEQRVNVIVDLLDNYERWSRLGHAYQLDVDIILFEGTDVLSVPVTALFREGQRWVIYAVRDGIVDKRFLEVGRQNAFSAEILSGLEEGDQFVVYPNNQIIDGVAVEPRDRLITE